MGHLDARDLPVRQGIIDQGAPGDRQTEDWQFLHVPGDRAQYIVYGRHDHQVTQEDRQQLPP